MLKTRDYFNHLLNKFAKNHQLFFYTPLSVHQNVLLVGIDMQESGLSSRGGSVLESRMLFQSLESTFQTDRYACKPRIFVHYLSPTCVTVCCAGAAGCLLTPAYKCALEMNKTPLNCQN